MPLAVAAPEHRHLDDAKLGKALEQVVVRDLLVWAELEQRARSSNGVGDARVAGGRTACREPYGISRMSDLFDISPKGDLLIQSH